MIDGAVALLDQGAGDAAPAEIGRKREPDRTAADDEDRRFRFAHAGTSPSSGAGARRGSAGKG